MYKPNSFCDPLTRCRLPFLLFSLPHAVPMSSPSRDLEHLSAEDQCDTMDESKNAATHLQSNNETQILGGKRKHQGLSEGAVAGEGDNDNGGLHTRQSPTRSLDADTHAVIGNKGKSADFDTLDITFLYKTTETMLDDCLDALFYQDGERRPLTRCTLKLIDEAQSKVGDANALFLEGFRPSANGFKYFAEAERKGCDHPILYYCLGEGYTFGPPGFDEDHVTALKYYEKCIQGGCSWAYRRIYKSCRSYQKGRREGDDKAFNYLLQLEQSGIVDGFIFDGIGDCYRRGIGCKIDPRLARLYFQRTLDLGFPPNILCEVRSRWHGGSHKTRGKATFALEALKAEDKGLGRKDDRILNMLINKLRHPKYSPNRRVLGEFADKTALALHLCDVLIERKSPRGYYQMGDIYQGDMRGYMYGDHSTGLRVWREADRVGLAECRTYIKLILGSRLDCTPLGWEEKALQVTNSDYDALGVVEAMITADGRHFTRYGRRIKAMEHYERGLQVLRNKIVPSIIYNCMASTYGEMTRPVDWRKVVEYRIKSALAGPKRSRCDSLLQVARLYTARVRPVPQDGAKALELCDHALIYADTSAKKRDVYEVMAEVYELGIPPTVQDQEKARELRSHFSEDNGE